MVYYAVQNGKTPGIFTDWIECKNSVCGFKGAIYKKFTSLIDANNFVNNTNTDNTNTDNTNTDNTNTDNTSTDNINTDNKIKINNNTIYNNIKSSEYSDTINYNVSGWTNINNTIYIFTDGSSRINYKSKAMDTHKSNHESNHESKYNNSGIGVYLGFDCMNIKEQYYNKTNNQCELIAIDYAYKLIVRYYKELIENVSLQHNNNNKTNSKNIKNIIIVSDSEYSINACTKWMKNWKYNNWLTRNGENVKNKDILENIDASMTRIKNNNSNNSNNSNNNICLQVKIIHIRSHQQPDINDKFKFSIWQGNYIADALAQNKL